MHCSNFFAKILQIMSNAKIKQMLNFLKNLGNYFCVKSFRHTFASKFKTKNVLNLKTTIK
ncbi:hypothetical protein FBBAL38_06350 [Flavobacteria bacterium BAL38]|nr:hypothetical protein FBBAL38_06350 [Flavobacteria bacterium BAL38]